MKSRHGNLVLDSNNNIYISSTISDSYEFPIGSGNFRSLGDGWFFKLNYSTGDILISDKILKAPNSAFISRGKVHSVRDIVLDSNNNIIITGAFYGEIYVDLSSSSSLIMQGDSPNSTNLFMLKYDSDFNLLWNFQTGNDTPHEGYRLAYDSLNDLIYLSGFIGGTVNVNPLGEEYNLTSEGGTRSFIAAYDTNGQIEFGHVFSQIPGQNTGSAADVFLNILDNKLLVYGKYRGSPDLDITDDFMVPTISTTSWKSFASVYDLVEGPALIGQYFFGEINSSSSGYPSEIILNGNDLIIATDKDRTMELYDYNQSPLVSLTNIAYENDNTYQSYSALVNFNIGDTTIPVITLLGENPVTIEVGDTYTDLGATAIDNYDGDITSSIVTVNPVDTAVVGVYTVTYNVTDANGNPAEEVTRTVNVEDALSVVEIEKIELDIFPNPTSNIWQIKSSKMIESLDLFDLTGKRLIYKKTLSNDIQIDATSLPDGVYLILINKNKLLRLIKH